MLSIWKEITFLLDSSWILYQVSQTVRNSRKFMYATTLFFTHHLPLKNRLLRWPFYPFFQAFPMTVSSTMWWCFNFRCDTNDQHQSKAVLTSWLNFRDFNRSEPEVQASWVHSYQRQWYTGNVCQSQLSHHTPAHHWWSYFGSLGLCCWHIVWGIDKVISLVSKINPRWVNTWVCPNWHFPRLSTKTSFYRTCDVMLLAMKNDPTTGSFYVIYSICLEWLWSWFNVYSLHHVYMRAMYRWTSHTYLLLYAVG